MLESYISSSTAKKANNVSENLRKQIDLHPPIHPSADTARLVPLYKERGPQGRAVLGHRSIRRS